MKRSFELVCSPEVAANDVAIKQEVAKALHLKVEDLQAFFVVRKSIDARGKQVKIRALVDAYWGGEDIPAQNSYTFPARNVSNAKEVAIIGAGPAGLFAALECIRAGIKPVIFERGKNVQDRRRDLRAINQMHLVNPESNYCFGEGGAGTYSDGKLYTRSHKRGNVQESLEWLVAHGATDQILVDAHPHIGTNKLPKIIENIRQTIIDCGGEVHFNTKVTGLLIENNTIKGLKFEGGVEKIYRQVVLATGHSARDVFQWFKDIPGGIEAKPFALGVRIEHPQAIIDQSQYHCDIRDPYLPPAAYSLVEQVNGKGVYSFCMCPGGFIVPSATNPGELVVNGMSPSKRDSVYANSGLVVAVDWEEVGAFHKFDQFAFLEFQAEVERKAWIAGGKTQAAPAQRVGDFIRSKVSADLPSTSYQPGIISQNLNEVLPAFIHERLREGLKVFGKKIKGYDSNEGVLVGVESRTSSPVRIPRNSETLEHTNIKGLYPCAEGAGYAGGIISACLDGIRVVKSIVNTGV